MNIKLHPKEIFTKLLLVYIIILLPNIAGIIIRLNTEHANIFGLIPLFDFDKESNIPTLYSTFILIVCATLLFAISHYQKSVVSPSFLWKLLGFIFLFLAIDEFTMVHERLAAILIQVMGSLRFLSELFFFPWVIPYLIAFFVLGILYLRFLLSLPKKTLLLFITSSVIYLSGAVGFEMLGGREAHLHGFNTPIYSILYTCEESFEMLGGIIFIYTLLSYLESKNTVITLNFKNTY